MLVLYATDAAGFLSEPLPNAVDGEGAGEAGARACAWLRKNHRTAALADYASAQDAHIMFLPAQLAVCDELSALLSGVKSSTDLKQSGRDPSRGFHSLALAAVKSIHGRLRRRPRQTLVVTTPRGVGQSRPRGAAEDWHHGEGRDAHSLRGIGLLDDGRTDRPCRPGPRTDRPQPARSDRDVRPDHRPRRLQEPNWTDEAHRTQRALVMNGRMLVLRHRASSRRVLG